MKHKMITIFALLAMMVALTGAASATQLGILRDGQLLGEPILVKNNEQFNVALQVTFLRTQDLGTVNPIGITKTGCTDETGASNVNCDVSDVNLTALKQNFTVTSIPTSTQDDSARLEVNVPLSRQPGTQYSYAISVGPFGDPPVPAQASRTIIIQGSFITGKKCNDINGNGICDPGEPGLPGWTINLRDNGNVTATTQTDADGNYAFKGQEIDILDPNTGAVIGTAFLGLRGTFTVVEVLQAGWTQTGPQPVPPGTHTVTVDAENATGLDFANRQVGSISGQKWNDLNGDAVKDASEPRLSGWTITLTKPDGSTETAQTDANGNYNFSNLAPGNYTVSETLQAGWKQTAPIPVPPGTHTVNLAGGQNVADRDFGNQMLLGSISGQKWNDLNGDAVKDASEPRLSGWTITLTKPDGSTETAQTDANGNYNFSNLAPGTYVVSETLQVGWAQTAPIPVPPGTHTVNLAAGQNVADRDFGNRIVTGSISGQKWNDTNGDGIKGATEPRLANWTITLTKPDGSTETTQTDANGDYSFTNLLPGTYTVSETLQAGWNQTFPAAPGTHTVTLSAGQNATGIDFGNKKPEELKPGKVVGWGTLGNKAAPELTFKVWAYTNFMPKGTVEAEDDAGNVIKATQIDSVLTDKTANPMTGEIKGKAMFNNEGPFDFVVIVTDDGQKDTFAISIPDKNYHKSGTSTSGDLQVIK